MAIRKTERTALEVQRQAETAVTVAGATVPAALARSQCGTVVVLDISGMRELNRRHGVVAGDRLLAAIETTLLTFMHDSVVVRLPGDQFVVIVPDETAHSRIEDDVRHAVQRTSVTGSWFWILRTTAHTGSAHWHDEPSRLSVIARADSRLTRGD